LVSDVHAKRGFFKYRDQLNSMRSFPSVEKSSQIASIVSNKMLEQPQTIASQQNKTNNLNFDSAEDLTIPVTGVTVLHPRTEKLRINTKFNTID
jgi:hypothetical protein